MSIKQANFYALKDPLVVFEEYLDMKNVAVKRAAFDMTAVNLLFTGLKDRLSEVIPNMEDPKREITDLGPVHSGGSVVSVQSKHSRDSNISKAYYYAPYENYDEVFKILNSEGLGVTYRLTPIKDVTPYEIEALGEFLTLALGCSKARIIRNNEADVTEVTIVFFSNREMEILEKAHDLIEDEVFYAGLGPMAPILDSADGRSRSKELPSATLRYKLDFTSYFLRAALYLARKALKN